METTEKARASKRRIAAMCLRAATSDVQCLALRPPRAVMQLAAEHHQTMRGLLPFHLNPFCGILGEGG